MLSCLHGVKAQTVHVLVQPVFKDAPVQFGTTYYPIHTADSIIFEDLRVYFSGFKLWNNDTLVWTEPESYHLCEVADNNTFGFTLQPGTAGYNRITFNLGIDSATNAGGIKGGCLDPTKGMYWAWQSGYINCKIEGRSNLCATRLNEFQFHLGGYLAPGNALQQLSGSTVATGFSNVKISIPFDEIMQNIDLKKQNQIMIPGEEAVQLSHLIAEKIKVQLQ
jgi:hypothetical protein